MAKIVAKWLNVDSTTLVDNSGALGVKLAPASSLTATAEGLSFNPAALAEASIPESALALGSVLKADGSVVVENDQNFNNHRITNLAAPTHPLDAANRQYVDNAIAGTDWQRDVLGVQTDATLSPELVAGSRYIITDPAHLNAAFGTISGVKSGDIVEYNGSAFTVVYSVQNNSGALVWDRGQAIMLLWDGAAWSEFGAMQGVLGAGVALESDEGLLNVKYNPDLLALDGSGRLTVASGSVSVNELSVTGGNGVSIDATENEISLTALSSHWNLGGTHTLINVPTPVNAGDVVNLATVSNLQALSRVISVITLNSTHITANGISIGENNVRQGSVQLSVAGAPALTPGVDYQETIADGFVTGVTWGSTDLASILAAGDHVTLVYSRAA